MQRWKLFVSSLWDLQGKQFFLILPAERKAHFQQYENKSSHSPSSLLGTWTNVILSDCFWLAPLRFWVPFISCRTSGEGVRFLRLLLKTARISKSSAVQKHDVCRIKQKILYLHSKYLQYLWNLNMNFNQPFVFIWQSDYWSRIFLYHVFFLPFWTCKRWLNS